ncbi:MAG: DNA translocase FtsK 4TM domain-containing protein, partial [Defluviitaleaceae bacterium]|nr:DNA translocase FtsK 4TM domain-containing protein [Defluviitaleaceae bacterium]
MAGRQRNTRAEPRPAAKPASRPRARRGASGRAARRAARAASPIAHEASCLLMIGLGVLSAVFVYFEAAGGVVGTAIRTVLVGVVGSGALVLPPLLMVMGVMGLVARDSVPRLKTLLASLLFLCAITLMAIPSVNTNLHFTGVADYLRHYYTHGSGTNGGVVGAALANLLLVSLGTFGSYVMIITIVIILAVFLTGKSVMSVVAALRERFGTDYFEEYYEDEAEQDEEPDEDERRVRVRRPAKKEAGGKIPFFTIGERRRREGAGVALVNEGTAAQEQTLTIVRDEETGKIAGLAIAEEEDDPDDDAPFDTQEPEGETYVSREQPAASAPKDAEPEIVIKENTNKFIDLTGDHESDTKRSAAEDDKPLHIPMDSADDEDEYIFPAMSMLKANPNAQVTGSRSAILENSRKLEDTLKSFGVEAKVVEVSKGPTVTRYELSPGVGVKVSRISSLADDLALNLAAVGIRIEAPIPGKAAVGIEIPNKEISPVYLREVIEDEAFRSFPSKLAFALGKDIAGNTVIADIAKMPHLLIAGATGSGKSVCINTLITSIIYKATPKEVKLLMVDPKVVELSIYNGIPHLLIPVVTDAKKASGALFWAVQEMVRRYNLFAETAVRDLKGYNAMLAEDEEEPLPQIVIIIDELA